MKSIRRRVILRNMKKIVSFLFLLPLLLAAADREAATERVELKVGRRAEVLRSIRRVNFPGGVKNTGYEAEYEITIPMQAEKIISKVFYSHNDYRRTMTQSSNPVSSTRFDGKNLYKSEWGAPYIKVVDFMEVQLAAAEAMSADLTTPLEERLREMKIYDDGRHYILSGMLNVFPMEVFFNRETLLPEKSTIDIPTPAGRITAESFYKDHRNFSGIMLPGRTRGMMMGMQVSSELKKITFRAPGSSGTAQDMPQEKKNEI